MKFNRLSFDHKYFFMTSCLILGTSSWAQTAAETHELEEVTVTAIKKTPPIYTIQESADDLTKNLVQDERDLFRNQVGIGISESGRSGSNGFAIRGVDKDRVAISVDGMPQAETFMPIVYKGYGYFNGSINTTEYENISQVAITKGANSVESGSGAIGGSVRFTTKNIQDFVKPGEHFGFYTKSGYASKNKEWRQVLGAGLQNEHFFGFAQVTKRNGHETKNSGYGDDIYGSARGKPDPVSHRSTSWLSKIGYKFNEEQKLTAFYEDRKQSQHTEEKSFDSFGTHRFASDTAPYSRYGVEYEYSPTDSSWLDTFNFRLAKQKLTMSADTYNVEKNNHDKVDQQYKREFFQQQKLLQAQLFSQEINLGKTTHQFQGKLEHRHASLNNINHDIIYLSSGSYPSTYSIANPVKSRISALSIQDNIQWTPQFKTQLGLRYDHYEYRPQPDSLNKFPLSYTDDKRKFSQLSWQSKFDYQLNENHQLSYTIGTGFRAPKVEEIYFEFGKGGANHFMPNLDLKPETALNQELGYQYQNENGQFGIGVFHSKYKNFIDDRTSEGSMPNPWYDPNSSWGGPKELYVNQIQFVNIAKASISGVEINGTLQGKAIGLPEGMFFNLKGTYSRGRNHDGDGLMSIQPWTALLGVGYEDPNDKWSTLFTLRYSSAKKGKDTRETNYTWRGAQQTEWKWLSPSYVVADLTGQFKLNKQLNLNVGVFNLFNRSYSTWDSMRSIPTYGTSNMIDYHGKGLERFTSPKRNFGISLEGKF